MLYSLRLARLRLAVPREARRRIHHTRPVLQSTCSSCGTALSTPLPACTKCWHISNAPAAAAHYDLLDIPVQPNPFIIDLNRLKQQFRKAQAVCHPDSWTSKGSDKQDVAQSLSARVNQAYQALLKPLSRIEYLLALNGNPMSETDTIEDMEFLGNVFETMSELQDAEPDERAKIFAENHERMQSVLKKIEQSVEAKNWNEAKDLAIRLRYLTSIADPDGHQH